MKAKKEESRTRGKMRPRYTPSSDRKSSRGDLYHGCPTGGPRALAAGAFEAPLPAFYHRELAGDGEDCERRTLGPGAVFATWTGTRTTTDGAYEGYATITTAYSGQGTETYLTLVGTDGRLRRCLSGFFDGCARFAGLLARSFCRGRRRALPAPGARLSLQGLSTLEREPV